MKRQVVVCVLLLSFLAAALMAQGCATTGKEVKKPEVEKARKEAGKRVPPPPPGMREMTITQIEGEKLPLKAVIRSGKIVSLSLAQEDIRNVLMAFSKETGVNIFMDPDVKGRVSADLKDITIMEALDTLLPPLGLRYEVRHNIIYVSRKKMETRIFKLNYIMTKREGSGELSVSGGITAGEGEGEDTSTASVQSKTEYDLWKTIQEGLENLVFGPTAAGVGGGELQAAAGGIVPVSAQIEGGEEAAQERPMVLINKQSGIILVKAYPEVLQQVARFLEKVEGSVQRQVLIEARIMEVLLDDQHKLGIDWDAVPSFEKIFGESAKGALSGGAGIAQALSPATGVFQLGVTSDYADILLDAMSKQGKINMLSKPRIATLNNQKAIIKVGREDVFWKITVQYDPETGKPVSETAEAQTITEGIVLDVTPQIGEDGFIMMNIHPSISEKVGESVSRLGDVAPVMDVRETHTVIRVRDGQTIVIAGLMKEKTNEQITSVPLLGDIPYLGMLFRRTEQSKAKVELVVMLTPRIMAGRKVQDLSEEELKRFEELKGGYHLGPRPWIYDTRGEMAPWRK